MHIEEIYPDEDIFSYIQRVRGRFQRDIYGQILGAANSFKDGDAIRGLAADNAATRSRARELLSRSRIEDINAHPVFIDALQQLISRTTEQQGGGKILHWPLHRLKTFLLEEHPEEIKKILPGLHSDLIALVVRLMNNDELCQVGSKIFHPLPGSNLGAKGYLGARIQPNSPTDHPEDILWQVFNGWSYATGDLILGTNPVSDSLETIHAMENILHDALKSFGLEEHLPWCVLSHIDKQVELEHRFPQATAIWFQSLAGVDEANQIFDISIDKMVGYARQRRGRYGLYLETGQGADGSNGMAKGFDMVLHESRKYGFVRALRCEITEVTGRTPWIHVNDVGGFIGPEVFRTKKQLVRACIEDTVMGKLHGLTTGLDICATLHMDISPHELDQAQDEIIRACPAYLIALPTKNDPMLSYLTTGFQDHVRLRHIHSLRVNDVMWDFFKHLEIITPDGRYTNHFGDPVWVYFKYRQAKGDNRPQEEIYREGREAMQRIENRGVPLAVGHGTHYWDLKPELDSTLQGFFHTAKKALWAEIPTNFILRFPKALPLFSKATDRATYIDHPVLGEQLHPDSISLLHTLLHSRGKDTIDVQIVISDGLNALAITEQEHLHPYLESICKDLQSEGYRVAEEQIFIRFGRVRTGYAIGSILFAQAVPTTYKALIHVIGERPGSGHNAFSVYIAAPQAECWAAGTVNHNIARVISGISSTSLKPRQAARETVQILNEMTKTKKRNCKETSFLL